MQPLLEAAAVNSTIGCVLNSNTRKASMADMNFT
jgi:hypothetical protein